MDFPFFNGSNKTTVSLLSIAVIGLLSPTAIAQIAQEELPPVEVEVERLEQITMPQGTVEQLEGVEPRNSDNSSFAVGGILRDDADSERFYLGLDYRRKDYFFGNNVDWYVDSEQDYYFFGRKLRIQTHFDDWLTLNHGEGPRGHISIPIILF